MLLCLCIILALIFVLPLCVKKIEQNLEIFLFVMGILAALTAHILNADVVREIFSNPYLYLIVAVVLAGGLLFRFFSEHIRTVVHAGLAKMPLELFVFLLTVILGLLSSIITAIVASLCLVEIINLLPLQRQAKIKVNIAACFSIGLGAVLTPVGEPLSTIIVSKLHVGFFYMLNILGALIIPGIVAFGLLAVYFASKGKQSAADENVVIKLESHRDIVIRALKIFLFIIALDLLGSGFKPVIDAYVVNLNSKWLFWINMSSAILDNATLASAEISVKMSTGQIVASLMGLLLSGGMMIPGNIPNIISAGKLKITSKEWIRLGVPLGLIVMLIYFLILFYIPV